jgi:Ca-activated chloride channel family protein
MTFIWPLMLVVLAVLPVMVIAYTRIQRRRRRLAASLGAMGSAPAARPPRGDIRRHVPPAFFLAGLAILGVALARPRAVVSLPRQQGIVILAFDVSGSMAATDLAPTRMEAAKVAARAFVQRQPKGVLIGVVAFSDGGLAVQQPVADSDLVLAAINRLAPQRGTSLGQGILAALAAISAGDSQGPLTLSNLTPAPTLTPTAVPTGVHAPAAIVLLTDGENNESPDPLAAAQQAADRGVRIYAVGVGSPAGITLKVNGFTVHTQLDEAGLRQVAQISGGQYYAAANAGELLAIYQSLDLKLVSKPEELELTALLAGASLAVILLGGAFSLLWYRRLP